MNSVNRLKVAIAFLAGLVVALGGALIYVKSSSPPTTSAAVPPSTPPVAAPPAALAPASDSTPAPPPVPVTAPARVVPEDKPVSRKRMEPKRHKTEPTISEDAAAPASPVQMARNPASTPTVTPAFQRGPEPEPISAPLPPPPPVQPKTVTLGPGTDLAVRLNETLSTDRNFEGDTFRATLATPIIRNGFVIAGRGAPVTGRIVSSEKAGRVKGLAELTLALTSINTTDGQQIRVETNSTDVKGPTSKKRDTAEVIGGSALGAIIGAIAGGGKGAAIGAGTGGAAGAGGVLLTRGKPAVIQAETQLTFQLSAPVTITEHLNR